jgi:ubiquinone/menaquinone biosynthesis C-methylase UbiE
MSAERYRAFQEPSNAPHLSAYWDNISRQIQGHYYHNTLIGHIKRDIHLKLITRWCGNLENKIVLKTDLFEEAHGPDQFLFEIRSEKNIIGMDISSVIARKAQQNAYSLSCSSHKFLTCDVLKLPFTNNSLDVVISNSTLDHFSEMISITRALSEIFRVLKPGGTLILTLDNKNSISYFISLAKKIFRPDPFYIGKTCSASELHRILQDVGFIVNDMTAVVHGMENHTSAMMGIIQKLNNPLINRIICHFLIYMERLEFAKTKYLTGAFIAAKAFKPQPI